MLKQHQLQRPLRVHHHRSGPVVHCAGISKCVISESVTQSAIQRQVYQKLYENAVIRAQGVLDQVVEYYMSLQFNEQAQRKGAYQAFIEMGYSESEAAKLAEMDDAAPYAYNLVGQLAAQISLESNVRLNTKCPRNADAINTMEMTNETCTNGATINFAIFHCPGPRRLCGERCGLRK